MNITRKNGRILFDNKQFHELNYDETLEANKILLQIDNHLSMSTLVDMVKKKAFLLGKKAIINFEKA